MYAVGLTGSIGSGKTTVAELFTKYYHIAIISADECAQEVIQQRAIIEAIAQHFGKTVLNAQQQVNRQYLREIITNDSKAKAWVDRLMHPIIREKIYQKAKASRSDYTIIEIPLLAKNNLRHYSYLKKIIIVVATPQLKINRIMARDNSNIEQANLMLSSQISDQERMVFSNYMIENNTSKTALKKQVEAVHRAIVCDINLS